MALFSPNTIGIYKEWSGQDEDNVYLIYGSHMRKQELKDGRKIIAYDFVSGANDSPNYCEVKFIIEDGTVASATYRGNFGAV